MFKANEKSIKSKKRTNKKQPHKHKKTLLPNKLMNSNQMKHLRIHSYKQRRTKKNPKQPRNKREYHKFL